MSVFLERVAYITPETRGVLVKHKKGDCKKLRRSREVLEVAAREVQNRRPCSFCYGGSA